MSELNRNNEGMKDNRTCKRIKLGFLGWGFAEGFYFGGMLG